MRTKSSEKIFLPAKARSLLYLPAACLMLYAVHAYGETKSVTVTFGSHAYQTFKTTQAGENHVLNINKATTAPNIARSQITAQDTQDQVIWQPAQITAAASTHTYAMSGAALDEPLWVEIEGKFVKAAGGGAGEQKPDFVVSVLKVEITPSEMNATESLNSGTFTCTVTPTGLNPTYQWLIGSANDAWPATAGNNPELDYSASTASSTIVNETRWFAPTPDRRQVVDGEICYYNINCEVTVGGVKCRASTPAILSVTVDMSGQTVGCVFQDWETITVAETGGIWQVTGQGNFSRSAPVASVNIPSTSQFCDKAMVHENKHVEQWMTGMFKDLKDANALYTSTLSTLTSTNSEADLRSEMLIAVYNQSTADDEIYNSKVCDAEDEAFDAENAEEPDFLELDDADWKPGYGCQ